MTSLKVDNISFDTDEEELRGIFKSFGEIGDVYIPRNISTKQSKGFAFVRFIDERDAEDAVKDMTGKEIRGREIKVMKAQHKKPEGRPRGASGGGGYRGGGGGGGYGGRDRYDDRRGGGGGYGGNRGYDDRGYGGGGGYSRGGYDDRRGGGGGYDDRRGGGGGGYDDRRGGGGGYDDRR